MPEMQNKKMRGHDARFEISCVIDYDKLPVNFLIVACSGVNYFWRKMKAFRPLEGRRCDEIQFEWIHLVNYYSRKPFTR